MQSDEKILFEVLQIFSSIKDFTDSRKLNGSYGIDGTNLKCDCPARKIVKYNSQPIFYCFVLNKITGYNLLKNPNFYIIKKE